MAERYAHLGNLIGAYLNQDYKYFGDTLEEVLRSYGESNDAEEILGLRDDIACFMQEFAGGLDTAFAERYGLDFDPKLWGLTAESFLSMVLEVTASMVPSSQS